MSNQNHLKLYTLIIAALSLLGFDFLIQTTTAQTSSSSCGPQFPNICTCGREMYESQLQYVVRCENAGLHNTSVLEFLPDEVQVLIFTGNKIPELPWNVFGSINSYEQLKIVDMSNNHIREIRGKSYHHVPNVERLLLNHNNLSISRDDDEVNHHHARVFSNFVNLKSLHLTNAFDDNSSPELSADLHDIFIGSHLTNLQKLHLEQNEISHFNDRRIFCDLPSLRDLHLGENYLTDLSFDIQCLRNLRFLDLQANHFEFVKTHDLMALNELENRKDRTTNLIVDFNSNRFVCDCRISPFVTWMRITNVTNRNQENLKCFRNKNLPMEIDKLEMSDCTPAMTAALMLFNADLDGIALSSDTTVHHATHMNGHTVTLIFLLIVLSMILFGLITALIYISRDKIKYMITPVFDNVTKKVQYTSIKDEDCPEVHV